MRRWKLTLMVARTVLGVSCLSSVFVEQMFGQENKKAREFSRAKQEVSGKVFEEAKRYLLDKKLATERQIERTVKTCGRAAVVWFARGKGWKGLGVFGNAPSDSGRARARLIHTTCTCFDETSAVFSRRSCTSQGDRLPRFLTFLGSAHMDASMPPWEQSTAGSGFTAPVVKAAVLVDAQKLFRDKSISVDDICGTLKISRTTLYKYVALERTNDNRSAKTCE